MEHQILLIGVASTFVLLVEGNCPDGYDSVAQDLHGIGKDWSQPKTDPNRNLQQCADNDGADRETVAGGHGHQGPGHPHLAPLYLPPRLQHPEVEALWCSSVQTLYLRVEFEEGV